MVSIDVVRRTMNCCWPYVHNIDYLSFEKTLDTPINGAPSSVHLRRTGDEPTSTRSQLATNSGTANKFAGRTGTLAPTPTAQ